MRYTRLNVSQLKCVSNFAKQTMSAEESIHMICLVTPYHQTLKCTTSHMIKIFFPDAMINVVPFTLLHSIMGGSRGQVKVPFSN